jgi:tRNA-2-methylthio-N6-dimethylallyladenosine synthase
MKRTYTREEYLEKIGLIRGARRPISITTDIIVGFPGETDEDFEETLSLLDVAQFDGTFSFQYSPRPHTEAALMADPVPESEKVRRLQALLERQRGIQVQRNQSLVGQTFEALVEGATRKESHWTGRTSSNRVLNFTSSRTDLLGEYVRVRVTGAGPNSLTGEQCIE